MKLPPSFWMFAIAWFLAPEVVAGQQIIEMERGQKARPDPVLATPAIIAQAADQGATPKQDIKTISFCRDKQSAFPLFNEFSPISDEFLHQIGAKHGFTIDELKTYRVTLVTPPQHGQIQLLDEQSHYWSYLPTKDYTGADRAIYLVETQGKQYKVVVNFWVVEVIDENRKVQECESINFGTQNGSSTTVTGLAAISLSDFEAWQREAQLLKKRGQIYLPPRTLIQCKSTSAT